MKILAFIGLAPIFLNTAFAKPTDPPDCRYQVIKQIPFDAQRSSDAQKAMIDDLCLKELNLKVSSCQVGVPSRYLGRSCQAQTRPVYNESAHKLIEADLEKHFPLEVHDTSAELVDPVFDRKLIEAQKLAAVAIDQRESLCKSKGGVSVSAVATDSAEHATGTDKNLSRSGEIVARSRCMAADATPEKIEVLLVLEFRK